MAESVFKYRFCESKKLLLILVFPNAAEFLWSLNDSFISDLTGNSVSLGFSLIGVK
jgi:uncharacterized membrane protein YoaK (UPF0700 family)